MTSILLRAMLIISGASEQKNLYSLLKNCFFAMITCFITCNVYAQNGTFGNNRIIQAPPDVAALMKFTEVPVSNFNGTAQVNVPLYEIKTGDISFPITLNYHTGGVKAAEEAGSVGLGWSLSAIGAIYESIAGMPDVEEFAKQRYNIYPYSPVATSPDFHNAYNLYEVGAVYKDANGNCIEFHPEYNIEPDVFSLNAGGYSAKFINLTSVRDFRVIDGQNIKLERSNVSYYGYDGFRATMPNGTVFLFNDIGRTFSRQDPMADPLVINHSAYLSKIISAQGKTITFKYKDMATAPQTRGQQSLNELWWLDNVSPFTGYTKLTSPPLTENVYLDEIDFDNGYVKFTWGNRDDMSGLKIEKMQVFQTGSVGPVKTVDFSYEYFSGVKSYGDYITESQFTDAVIDPAVTEAYRQKRLKLISVRTNDQLYQFEYDNTELPYKTSYAQDLWGYCNGNQIKTLLPDYNNLGYVDPKVPAGILNSYTGLRANRAANPEFAKAGSLTKVIYPTGGYTVFEYQGNTMGKTDQILTQLVDHTENATDIGAGVQQVEFTIPDVGYKGNMGESINPGKIIVNLFCCQPAPCNTSCPGYSCAGFQGFGDYGNGISLYAILESYNESTGTWVRQPADVFDNANTLLTGACGYTAFRHFAPGRYRITANYPDNNGPGSNGSKMAMISIIYKVNSQITSSINQIGPGLRIGKITDYSAENKIAFQRTFTYSPGALMTKPIFYRNGTDGEGLIGTNFCNIPVVGDPFGCLGSEGACCFHGQFFRRSYVSLYNSPVASYSYSANGSLVGYDSVTVAATDGNGNDNGKTLYVYNKKPDLIYQYSTMAPGTPGSPFLDNGSLKEETQMKKDIASGYQPVKSTFYTYDIGNFAIRWAYRYEWLKEYFYVDDPRTICIPRFGKLIESENPAPQDQFLSFYPIISGHVNLIKKEEKYYNGSNVLTQSTDYSYNQKDQLSQEVTYNSKDIKIATETYYPSDYSVSSGFIKDMQDRNMLDYPVEIIQKKNNLVIGATYNEFQLHDNIVTPNAMHLFTTTSPVSFTPSAPGNIKDSRYKQEDLFVYDSYGNLSQYQPKTNVTTGYLWGYNNALPITMATNALPTDVFYTGFENADGNSAAADCKAGQRSRTGGYSMSLTGLTNGAYKLSYWKKTGTGWNYQSTTINVSSGSYAISIPSSDQVDELRFYPVQAELTTYTYEPLKGISSVCDKTDHFTYYNFDTYGRLSEIRDHDGNIAKKFDYAYRIPAVAIPGWKPTGRQRCKPCPQNIAYVLPVFQVELIDTNPDSPTFNKTMWVDGGASSTCTPAPAIWQNTTTPVRCRVTGGNNTGEQEQEQIDINPCSPTYNKTQWIVVATNCSACPMPPTWQNTNSPLRCQLDANGKNTGYQEFEQKDVNQCSASYNKTRWLSTGQTSASCPVPSVCTSCTGNDHKCINSVCETGTLVVLNKTYSNPVCVITYGYRFSDGTSNFAYTQTVYGPCQ
jgi:hypothetical protein